MNNTKSSTTRVMIAEPACSGGSSSDTADYSSSSSSSSSSIIAKSPNNVLELDNMIQMVGDTNKEIVTTVVTKTIPSRNSTSTCDKKKNGERELLTTLDLDIPSMDDTTSDKPKSFQLLPIIKSNKEQQLTKDSTLSVVQIPYISPTSSSSSSSIVSSNSKSPSSFKHIFKSSLNVVSKHISKTKRLSASLGMYDEEEEEEEYTSKGHNDNEEGSSTTTGITTSSAKANKDEDVVREKEQTTTVDISDMIQHEEWDKVLQYVSTSKGIDDIKRQLNKDYSCSSTTYASNAATSNSTSTETTTATTTTKTATSTTSAVSSSFNLLQLSLMYNPPLEFLNTLKEFQPNLILSTTRDNEQTPLHIACSWGAPSDIIKFLIDWSTSSSASQVHLLKKDSNGNIPLHLLCGVMWPHLQKQQRQQKPKQIDSETTTSVQNFKSCIQLLIKCCPQSVSVMNNDGIMPLQYLPPLVASEWICYSLKEQVFVAKKAMFVKQVMM